MPGFFAVASKTTKAKVCPEPFEGGCDPLPAPKQSKPSKKPLRHSHLALMKEPEEAPPLPPKPSPKPIPQKPEPSLSQDESWALLAKMNPSKGKKRKTVHKEGCKCFLCAPKKKVRSTLAPAL